MKNKSENYGFAIALAWPQTFCKEPGAWYDPVTRWLGINKNNYYQAGHAALVLIDSKAEKCHYFDFGRYHAPFQHGRVRSADTDHDLAIVTRPVISENGNTIHNFDKILEELQQNAACHGEGPLFASYCAIDFQAALNKARQMISDSPLPYGPFIKGGSNCSRFVNTVILAGRPDWKFRFRLTYFLPLTPTPVSNVNSLDYKKVVPKLQKATPFYPLRPLSKSERFSTLLQPARHPDIPENAQWLGGEGAGSWFVINYERDFLVVTRYSPDGVIECSGKYEGPDHELINTEDSMYIDYLSNCKEVTINSKGNTLKFYRINTNMDLNLFSSKREEVVCC